MKKHSIILLILLSSQVPVVGAASSSAGATGKVAIQKFDHKEEKLIKDWRMKAKHGSVSALYALGLAYRIRGLEERNELQSSMHNLISLIYFERAAKRGHREAQREISKLVQEADAF